MRTWTIIWNSVRYPSLPPEPRGLPQMLSLSGGSLGMAMKVALILDGLAPAGCDGYYFVLEEENGQE